MQNLKPNALLSLISILALSLFIKTATSQPQPSFAQEPNVTISGDLTKWHPLTLSFDGPLSNEWDSSPNPFLDYRLQVTFTGPSGQIYDVPGFFDGNGEGGKSGTVWRVRFAADEAGPWQYTASFRSGQNVSISLDPAAGEPIAFDGESGSFDIAGLDTSAPGFLSQGRLEYVDGHYLKFRDGDYWIKGGTNSPENFLAYAGFDFTVNQTGGLDDTGLTDGVHRYEPHIADWNEGDPNFVGEETGYDAKGIIGALNYLNETHVNSIYLLPMNLGGDGREVFPFTGPENSWYNKRHYDLSKLNQWNIVLEHAQENGIALNIVLAETESGNYQFLDSGELGTERKLFYRELIARFGHMLAIKWNLSEENPYPVEDIEAFASYIEALDWQDHPIAVHTFANKFDDYSAIVGDSRFSATSIQYDPDLANSQVERWRRESADAGHPWVLDMDENTPAGVGLTDTNATDLRKRALYDIYFSGGNVEWYGGYHDLPLGGDLRIEDFRTRDEMWQYTWHARKFMQDNLPFWDMEPADNLLSYSSPTFGNGQLFAKSAEMYAIYLPDGSQTALINLNGITKEFDQSWYNPRTGEFVGSTQSVDGNQQLNLGSPPADTTDDWVILLKATGDLVVDPNPTPTPPPPTPVPPSNDSIAIESFSLINMNNGRVIRELDTIEVIDLNTLPTQNVTIRANTIGDVGSVAFALDTTTSTDNDIPFELANSSGQLPWEPPIGRHVLTAIPFSDANGSGSAGETASVTLIIMDRPTAPSTPVPVLGAKHFVFLPLLAR